MEQFSICGPSKFNSIARTRSIGRSKSRSIPNLSEIIVSNSKLTVPSTIRQKNHTFQVVEKDDNFDLSEEINTALKNIHGSSS